MVNLKINGISVSVPEGSTILQAAKLANVRIPTLCYLKDVQCVGSCRLCLVEATGARGLVTACTYPVSEGMEVRTNTPQIRKSRKTTIELILSTHKKKCLSCARSMNCELQKLALEYNAEEDRFGTDHDLKPIDDLSVSVVRDNSKCVMCTRCVAACTNQTIGAIGPKNRGYSKTIGSPYDVSLAHTPCVNCGQCVVACPVGALSERSTIDEVWAALSDPQKQAVFFTAPSVRATLGEAFDMPVGTNVEGKMVAAIRRLGPDHVFNMDVTADLTIMEEASELINRIKTGKPMPMFTSCCPGWVRFLKTQYPAYTDHLSTAKSPQQMFGAICKTYYAEKLGVDPAYIVVVSIMPCTAKKFEKGRGNQNAAGVPDIDYALTTRELAKLIKRSGIIFDELPDEDYDSPLGLFSGAGLIFGVTGGVMEAALRTVYEVVVGKPAPSIDFNEVRGTEGIKEAEYDLNGKKVKVCVASGLANARKVMDDVRAGVSPYDFIEIMSCPGGCVNGGGQPIKTAYERNNKDIRTIRAKSIYEQDANMTLRKSHENPAIQQLYKDYLGEPNSHKAHEILHTSYEPRQKY